MDLWSILQPMYLSLSFPDWFWRKKSPKAKFWEIWSSLRAFWSIPYSQKPVYPEKLPVYGNFPLYKKVPGTLVPMALFIFVISNLLFSVCANPLGIEDVLLSRSRLHSHVPVHVGCFSVKILPFSIQPQPSCMRISLFIYIITVLFIGTPSTASLSIFIKNISLGRVRGN